MSDYPATRTPDQGVSRNALSIARMIDRLPLGSEYTLILVKPEMKGQSWAVRIVRLEVLQEAELNKEISG